MMLPTADKPLVNGHNLILPTADKPLVNGHNFFVPGHVGDVLLNRATGGAVHVRCGVFASVRRGWNIWPCTPATMLVSSRSRG